MSPCSYCADTGWSSIGMMCRCPKGAALRMQANTDAVNRAFVEEGIVAPFTCRPHTDGIDDRAESIRGPIATGPFPDDDLTPETMAERLAKTPPPIDRIPTPDHFICSTIGCSNRVSADNRKCWDCQAEEENTGEYDPTYDRLAILLYGIALGIALALIAVWLGMVRP